MANHRCAVCPTHLDYRGADILEVAHIRPVADGGPDDPRNALVLCPSHHALFDAGLWALSRNGKVVRSRKLPAALAEHLGERIPLGWKVDADCIQWRRAKMIN
nr:HNH endonuclease [Corallococcus sp. AS-1-12]